MPTYAPAALALHDALYAALTTGQAAADLLALGVAADAVVVNPPQGHPLPYVWLVSDTEAEGLAAFSDKNTRPAELTKTLRVFASTERAARAIEAVVITAGLAISVSGFSVQEARLDLAATGPENDPAGTRGPGASGAPLADRLLRLRYTLAPT